MSRIAKIPVTIAKGVTVAITEADVTVKGPVGEVKMHILPLCLLYTSDAADE